MSAYSWPTHTANPGHGTHEHAQPIEISHDISRILTFIGFYLPRHQRKGAIVTISRLINRNVVAERGRTSMRLEPELWEALLEICEREGQDMSALVRRIEQNGHAGGRTSAVRVFILSYFRDATNEAGHLAAGHGCSSMGGSSMVRSGEHERTAA
jgi:predicted DNA-binding ribbon-helix-helix protein